MFVKICKWILPFFSCFFSLYTIYKYIFYLVNIEKRFDDIVDDIGVIAFMLMVLCLIFIVILKFICKIDISFSKKEDDFLEKIGKFEALIFLIGIFVIEYKLKYVLGSLAVGKAIEPYNTSIFVIIFAYFFLQFVRFFQRRNKSQSTGSQSGDSSGDNQGTVL